MALVVDDDAMIRTVTTEILRRDGFSVLEACSAATALDVLEEHGAVQLLFTDIQMPGDMDGLGLAREVKRCWPDTAVVICSGKVRPVAEDIPERAIFISKPFSSSNATQIVRSILSRGSASDCRPPFSSNPAKLVTPRWI